MADQPLTGHAPFTPIKVRGETSMADPQHPDIAAPTLAQMPALIAKHDEFAALAAEHGHDEMAALHAVTAAALRTLTRPVEDEEVRATDAFLVWLGRSYPLARNDAKQLEKAQDILARLAREKASAEQEAARLRDELGKLQSLCTPEQINKWANWRMRALAAAAGAEEPR